MNRNQISSEKVLVFKASDIKNIFLSLTQSYADIFFIRSTACGILILTVTFLNYNAGISGILAVLAAFITAYFLGYQKDFIKKGYYAYNSVLVGLAIGFLFKISFLSLLIISISGSLTFIISLGISHIFYNFLGLHVLSIPFIIVSTLVYLSASSFTNLYVVSLYVPPYSLNLNIFPIWLSGYLKALGAIIFMPNEVSGLIIASLLLYCSRILFFLSFLGFSLGITLYGLFIGSIPTASQDINSFNYILIAMALGGVFNIPSIKSYTIGLLGVAMATLISSAGHVFWSQYGLPVFTLPFTLITLSFAYTFNILKYPYKTVVHIGTPEENLDYFISNKSRFADESVCISLPFTGRWHSWQGFDDKWTHQGLNKYAYDFIITDSSNQSYSDKGHSLTDYYCYGKEILSPVNGKVVQVIDHFPDNVIGSINTVNPWGNEVIIRDNKGYFVKLAHLAHQSITAFEGQSVDVGHRIGLCGNSGNSPQPHLHIQLQTSIFTTAPTIPFIFVNFGEGRDFIPFGLPEKKQDVTQCSFNLFYDQVTNFVLDEEYNYDVYLKEELVDNLSFKVKISDLLYTYFETSLGKLYFGKQYGKFYIYSCEGNDPYLKLFYLALSTMPISFVEDLIWQDTVNNSMLLNKWQQSVGMLLNLVNNGWVASYSQYQYMNDTTIVGHVKNNFFDIKVDTSILLDPNLKFKEIKVGNYKLLQSLPKKDNPVC